MAVCSRQLNRYDRAFALDTSNVDRPAMVPYDLVHDRQAQPCAPRPRTRKRLEQPLYLFGRHSQAVIFKLYPNAIVGNYFNADAESSAVRHRLDGIAREVPENLFKLGRVGIYQNG